MFPATAGMTAAGVTSSAVRMAAAKALAATMEAALWRMPASSHVEAAGTVAANALRRIRPAKEVRTARVRCFPFGACEILAGKRRPACEASGRFS